MVSVLSRGAWTGVSVDTAQFSGLHTERLAWGDVEDSVKSAYVFLGYSGVQVPLDGSKVPIGEFQHHNHAIPMPPNPIFTAELSIRVNFGGPNDTRTLGPVRFRHHETPNLSEMPEDRVELEQVDFDKVVEVEGRWYDMRVEGFKRWGEDAPVFISVEDAEPNTAELLVSFSLYTGPA